MPGDPSLDVQSTNLQQCLEQFDRLVSHSRRACREALDQSLTPAVEAYRSNLSATIGTQSPIYRSRRTGEYTLRPMRLFETPRKKIWPFPDGTGFAGLVGPKSGAAPHAHLIEDGTMFRFRKKIGGKYWLVELKIQKTGSNFRGLKPPAARQASFTKAYHPLQRAASATENAVQVRFMSVYGMLMTNLGVV